MQTQTSLERYRHSLHGIETLGPDDERALAAQYRAGDARAGERLVHASLPFVIRVANEYRRWGIPVEDLIQQGNLGLLKAAQKYDPKKNCRLITYAVYWIRAEIRDYVVRSYRIVRLGTTRTERRAMRAYRRTGVDSVEKLAQESGMPLARCEKLWPLLASADVSLDASYEDRSAAVSRLPADEPSPEDAVVASVDQAVIRTAVRDALKILSQRELTIVRARLLSDTPRTLEELGSEMGVSKERVRQLEARACTKLRGVLREYHASAA